MRDVTGWLTRHPDRLTDDQAQRLNAILARCPALDRTAHHVRSFAELMNNRQGRDLNQWITCDKSDDLPALHTFATGLGQDLDAVVAGLSSRYSSGARRRPQQQDQDDEAPDARSRQLRPAPQTRSPHRPRPFMLLVSVTLRGPGTKCDLEPLFSR